MTGKPSLHPFDRLTPGFIMDAIEAQGYRCDCRILTLNSYENRVYQVGIDDGAPLIAKFYRPGRWSAAQILEEHQFTLELAEHELPVVAPLLNGAQESLLVYRSFHFALYPRKGGQAPELDNLEHLKILGRSLGRIHLVGASHKFKKRPQLDTKNFGYESVRLVGAQFIPTEYQESYRTLTEQLLRLLDARFEECGTIQQLRIHGDCHSGNILWREGLPNFVDFDDSRMAPAIQDLWMLLSGDENQQRRQMEVILEGYHEFLDFNPTELRLIEPLRTLRMLNFSAWLARRWDDPAFPAAFPWFNSLQYWGNHILELREQFAALQEPPLQF